MSQDKRIELIITMEGSNIGVEINQFNCSSHEVLGVLEMAKATILNSLITNSKVVTGANKTAKQKIADQP
jgi:hypothetical protein